MSKYWLGNIPGSTMTSSEGERIRVLGVNIATSGEAANLGGVVSTLAGAIDVNKLIISSSVADVSGHVIQIDQAPVAGVITTSTTGAAGGTKITFTSEVASGVIGGYIKIRIVTSTGGNQYRYIAMFTTTESS